MAWCLMFDVRRLNSSTSSLICFLLFRHISRFSIQKLFRTTKSNQLLYYDWMEMWSLHINSKCFKGMGQALYTWKYIDFGCSCFSNKHKLTPKWHQDMQNYLWNYNMNLSWCPIRSAIFWEQLVLWFRNEKLRLCRQFLSIALKHFGNGDTDPVIHWKSESWIYTARVHKENFVLSQQHWVGFWMKSTGRQ